MTHPSMTTEDEKWIADRADSVTTNFRTKIDVRVALREAYALGVRREREECAMVADSMADSADWADDHSATAQAADKRATVIRDIIRARTP